ncbi:MAG TPA: histidine kinase [Bacteroidia bacterium]|nr:histidine kinase [Bacteroidia bacterium]
MGYKKTGLALCLSLFVTFLNAQDNNAVDSLLHSLRSANASQQKQILQNYTNTLVAEKDSILNVSLLGVIPFFIAFGFIVFLFYLKRREANFKAVEAEIQTQMAKVEMKALRAQMNPHFIFNCLNSIYHFMSKKDTEQASKYLIKFSNLIRSILENSLHQEVALKDDLEALELYIQLEQMRLDHKFKYEIQIDPSIEVSQIFVPPLIMQPFVENSIWHGLSNKESGGVIKIEIITENNMLKYILEDNGSNRIKPSDLPEIEKLKKSSIGIAATKERLDLVNQKNNSQANFLMTDLKDEKQNYCGKRIELKLPILQD